MSARARRVVGSPHVVDVLNTQPVPNTPQPTQPDPVHPQPTRPLPETQLTPEQRRIRELEDILALERGRKDPSSELEAPAEDGRNIIVHFVEDGFTTLGAVWYRGQELEFTPGSPAYHDTCDRTGRSWLELRHDDFAQVEKFGHVLFRDGPWRGKSYVDGAAATFEPLKALKGEGGVSPPTEEDFANAAATEQRRRRAAPRLPAV